MIKLAAFWAWIFGHGMALIVAGVVAFLVLTKVQSCRDCADSAREAVLTEKLKVDTVTDKQDSIGRVVAEQQLDAANETITRLLARLRTAPVVIPVGTPHDSITHLTAAVKSCRADNDTLVKSVVEFQSACEAYRESATKSLANKDIRYAHLDSLYQLGTQAKRVQPYGAGLYDLVNRRPVFRVGTTVKARWRIQGMGEAEYAIPSAIKTESGGGFRLLAGVRVNF